MRALIARTFDILGLKLTLYRITRRVEVYYAFHIKNLLKLKVIKQRINYKSIPIIIISFNQLFYLKQLVTFLKKHKYTKIVIIDNNSTYKPLLEYFETLSTDVKIHKLKENFGHLVFWKNKKIFNKYSKGYYMVTDADIVPDPDCPPDFVRYLKKVLERNQKITKVGFSLKIDDIPDTNPNKQKVINWESKFWENQNKEGNYLADIDTTFALYRPGYYYKQKGFYAAIRTRWPYQAKHGGWYLDIANLSEEQVLYFATCNESSSWRINEERNLDSKIYD